MDEQRLKEIDAVFRQRGYLTDAEWYDLLIARNGPPLGGRRPAQAEVERYRGRVPDLLIRLWLEHGFGSWNAGKIWLCEPGLLQPLLDDVFQGDPEYRVDSMAAYMYDAFGNVYVWLGSHRVLRLYWLQGYAIEQTYDDQNTQAGVAVSESENILQTIDGEIYTSPNGIDGAAHLGANGKDMLPAAVKRLGELTPGWIYGFVPALALGGPNRAANLHRVPVLEHLTLLASLQPLTLRRFIPPPPGDPGFGNLVDVRQLGRS